MTSPVGKQFHSSKVSQAHLHNAINDNSTKRAETCFFSVGMKAYNLMILTNIVLSKGRKVCDLRKKKNILDFFSKWSDEMDRILKIEKLHLRRASSLFSFIIDNDRSSFLRVGERGAHLANQRVWDAFATRWTPRRTSSEVFRILKFRTQI